MSLAQLKGKGAIVTGGGSGICLAFTKTLYYAGCSVLIADLALHREAVPWIESLKSEESNGSPSARIVFHKTDVTDWKQLREIFDVYEREFGGIPYVICPGAGIYEPSTNNFWNDRDEDSHYKLIDVDLVHPMKLTRIAIRKMLQANAPGVIICVSSTGAQKSSIVTPLYQAAKHGISNFVRCMGKLHELSEIRVIGVAPGPTMSPLMYDNPEAFKFVDPEKDRLATTEEVAKGMMAVCFDSKYPPGTILEVTSDGWREVHLLNDPGPQGAAGWTSKKNDAIKDVIKVLEEDRKSGSAS